MKKISLNKTPKQKPLLKWQTGNYSPHLKFEATLPAPFLLLCRIANVPPQQLLTDFINHLAGNTIGVDSRLVEYFIARGYGKHDYYEEDIRSMFKELDAMAMLFPKNGTEAMIKGHTQWLNKYQQYWYKKWYGKPSRQVVIKK